MEIRKNEAKFANTIKNILSVNIKEILFNSFNIDLSTNYEDCNLSYDMIFTASIKISVRLRTYKYINYNDITIRSKSKCNQITEIDKLISGHGKIYFYGWLSKDEQKIQKWIIVDIDKIRNKLSTFGTWKNNNDNTSFKVYNFDFLKKHNAIISQSK
jgi:hypothetical protein